MSTITVQKTRSISDIRPLVIHELNSANFSYQKPTGKDYESFKHKNSTFRVNRQPIPRSTYSCEYLTYGTMPKYRYKEDNGLVAMERASAGMGSTYKNDFKEIKNGKSAKMDFKDLDCYQDKFKYAMR